MSVLAIDAGTSGIAAIVLDGDGTVLAKDSCEFAQHFPAEGWVEHDPEQIWTATLSAVRNALDQINGTHALPTAVGVTNQRETVVLWDRQTLRSPRRAIVWQDRRTARMCDDLRDAGEEPRLARLTGLRLDPYFSATKLAWISRNEPDVWAGVESGGVAIGTIDSYLIARMTAGRLHVTDASNASRTLLYDLHATSWSQELCELFGVPIRALPAIVPSYGTIGRTDPAAFLGLDLPIAAVLGDQQAALFGQGCFTRGSTKCTYGTGAFVLANTGPHAHASEDCLLTTVAWQHPDGTTDYALEGSAFVAGAAVQWLRDGLQIVESPGETEQLAASVTDSGGVVFVPALTGLGAPHWDPYARGAILGLGRGTTRAHIARATLEAIAFQVHDMVDAITLSSDIAVSELAVDGGAAANDLLCQIQADILRMPVARARHVESTGLGAAFAAGLGTGVWTSRHEIRAIIERDTRFEPSAPTHQPLERWHTAIDRSKGWTAAGHHT